MKNLPNFEEKEGIKRAKNGFNKPNMTNKKKRVSKIKDILENLYFQAYNDGMNKISRVDIDTKVEKAEAEIIKLIYFNYEKDQSRVV